jgi:hypothetical protein
MEALGKFGIDALSAQRMPVSVVNLIIGVVTFIFYCVALAGCSEDEGMFF